MIAGTIIIEDSIISFVINQGETFGAAYTVGDAVTGKQESRLVPAPDFMLALGMALDFSGGDNLGLDNEQRASAERVQPLDPDLRFIP